MCVRVRVCVRACVRVCINLIKWKTDQNKSKTLLKLPMAFSLAQIPNTAHADP